MGSCVHLIMQMLREASPDVSALHPTFTMKTDKNLTNLFFPWKHLAEHFPTFDELVTFAYFGYLTLLFSVRGKGQRDFGIKNGLTW